MGSSDVSVNLNVSPRCLVCHHKNFLLLISHLGLAIPPSRRHLADLLDLSKDAVDQKWPAGLWVPPTWVELGHDSGWIRHARSFCPVSLCGYGTCSLEGLWSRITQLEIKARSLDSWFSCLFFTLWSSLPRRGLIRCCWKNEWMIVLRGIVRVLMRWAWLKDLNSYSFYFGTLQP